MQQSRSITFFVSVALAIALASAFPTNVLQARAKNCPGGGLSPCVCGGQFGIRQASAKLAQTCAGTAMYQLKGSGPDVEFTETGVSNSLVWGQHILKVNL